MAEYLDITGRIRTTASDTNVVETQEVFDNTKQQKQSTINSDFESRIAALHAQDYLYYDATSDDTSIATILPSTGTTGKIYRIANWNANATGVDPDTYYNTAYYSEYAWDANASTPAYTLLSVSTSGITDIPAENDPRLITSRGVKSAIDSATDEYNISIHNNNAEYTFAQAVALVPTSLRKGGLTIKYIDSTTHKYAIKRLMSSTWNTAESNWQVIGDVSTAIGINLLNPNDVDVKFGYYLDNNGVLRESSTYNLSGFIPVTPEESYVASRSNSFRFVNFYKNDKTHISSSQLGNVNTFTTPSDAAYIRVSIRVDQWNYAFVTKGNIRPDFVQYSPIAGYFAKPLNKSVTDETLNSETINTFSKKFDGLRCSKSNNLFDESTMVIEGRYINNGGGIDTGAGWAITDYIPIIAGENYYITAKTIARTTGLSWFNENKQLVSGGATQIYNRVQTAPEEAAYLVFNVGTNNTLSTGIMVAQSSTAQYFENPYIIPTDSVQQLKKFVDDEIGEKVDINKLNTINYELDCVQLKRSNNLFNEDTMIVNGKFINNSGGIQAGAGWAMTDYIPVEAGEKYFITATTISRTTGLSWFDSNKTLISGGAGQIFNQVKTAPVNAAYLVFNVAKNNVYSTDIMVAKSEVALPFENYYIIPTDSVQGLTKFVDEFVDDKFDGKFDFGKLNLYKFGSNYYLTSKNFDNNQIVLYIPSGRNGILNFAKEIFGDINISNTDDVAPAHILNITIGANHGQPCSSVTISNHGFDNTIIGTEWLHSNGKKYYPVQIVDVNTIMFLSENEGTLSSPIFTPLSAGVLTYNGTTYNISSSDITSSQLYPAVKNNNLKILADSKDVSSINGNFLCKECSFIESYDIVNPASVLENLINRAGQSSEPSYDGAVAATVENIYKIDEYLNVIVVANFIVKDTIAFSNVMFAQAARINENMKYYIPNSLPFGSVDLRTPQVVNWSSSQSSLFTNLAHTKVQDNPITRIIQSTDTTGFALGFLPLGVGENLFDYTSATFELRGNTGKMYPHGVDSDVMGGTLSAGDGFSAVMYRCFFNLPDSNSERQSLYHFYHQGIKYVFIDYKDSVLDKIEIDDISLNGKKISVIENQNAELKTNVYNDGFYVDANYVNNETCYIIVKIQ